MTNDDSPELCYKRQLGVDRFPEDAYEFCLTRTTESSFLHPVDVRVVRRCLFSDCEFGHRSAPPNSPALSCTIQR